MSRPYAPRRSTARACASNPSARAKAVIDPACFASASRSYAITDVRTTKSYTPSGDEYRTAPPVGNTCDGPAR